MEVVTAEKHFLWTMDGPHSSYSCLVIHICWKVEREDRMEPPIQTEYFLSGGAMILILMVEGARAVISFCILSAISGNSLAAVVLGQVVSEPLVWRLGEDCFLPQIWCQVAVGLSNGSVRCLGEVAQGSCLSTSASVTIVNTSHVQ